MPFILARLINLCSTVLELSSYYWGTSFHSVKFKKKRVLTALGFLLYKADMMAEIEGYIHMPWRNGERKREQINLVCWGVFFLVSFLTAVY